MQVGYWNFDEYFFQKFEIINFDNYVITNILLSSFDD